MTIQKVEISLKKKNPPRAQIFRYFRIETRKYNGRKKQSNTKQSGLRSPVGALSACRRFAAINGSKFRIKSLPSVGKLATRWRDCGGHCFVRWLRN